MYLWCNGRFVGYAEDSFTPSEFELTEYLRDGVNRLCVEVYKRSSAAWDRGPGLFSASRAFSGRSTSTPSRACTWPMCGCRRAWQPTTPPARWLCALRLEGEAAGAKVTLRLTDREGYALYDGPVTGDTLELPGVQPWCHATPTLYHAELTLTDAEGTVQEVVPYDVGFRRFGAYRRRHVLKRRARRLQRRQPA